MHCFKDSNNQSIWQIKRNRPCHLSVVFQLKCFKQFYSFAFQFNHFSYRKDTKLLSAMDLAKDFLLKKIHICSFTLSYGQYKCKMQLIFFKSNLMLLELKHILALPIKDQKCKSLVQKLWFGTSCNMYIIHIM